MNVNTLVLMDSGLFDTCKNSRPHFKCQLSSDRDHRQKIIVSIKSSFLLILKYWWVSLWVSFETVSCSESKGVWILFVKLSYGKVW